MAGSRDGNWEELTRNPSIYLWPGGFQQPGDTDREIKDHVDLKDAEGDLDMDTLIKEVRKYAGVKRLEFRDTGKKKAKGPDAMDVDPIWGWNNDQ